MMNRIANRRFLSRQIVFGIVVGIMALPVCSFAKVVTLDQVAGNETETNATYDKDTGDAANAEQPPFQQYVKKYHRCYLGLMGQEDIDGPTAIMILGIGSAILHAIASSGLWGMSRLFVALKDPTEAEQTGVSELAGTVARFAVYYLIAAIAAAFILRYICHLELLGAVGFETVEFTKFGSFTIDKGDVDVFFTGLIMWLGTERVGHWLNIPGGPTPKTVQPVVISGDLQLKEPATQTPE